MWQSGHMSIIRKCKRLEDQHCWSKSVLTYLFGVATLGFDLDLLFLSRDLERRRSRDFDLRFLSRDLERRRSRDFDLRFLSRDFERRRDEPLCRSRDRDLLRRSRDFERRLSRDFDLRLWGDRDLDRRFRLLDLDRRLRSLSDLEK